MNIFESDFMRRLRYLPEEKRCFFLDTMEQSRKDVTHNVAKHRSSSSYEYQKILHKKVTIALQKGAVAIWMLLDDPAKRDVQQMEARLNELERLVTDFGVMDIYHSVMARIEQTGTTEKMGYTREMILEDKQKEYGHFMATYIKLSESDRQKFIEEIRHPLAHYRPHLKNQMGRQRES